MTGARPKPSAHRRLPLTPIQSPTSPVRCACATTAGSNAAGSALDPLSRFEADALLVALSPAAAPVPVVTPKPDLEPPVASTVLTAEPVVALRALPEVMPGLAPEPPYPPWCARAAAG